MSETSLWVFVEGRLDVPFYETLISSITNMSYRIVRIDEVAELQVGGKRGLLEYFQRARRAGALDQIYKGKRSVLLFFADKDLDDVLRLKVRSDHFRYTSYYCLENYLFRYGQLSKVLAVSLGWEKTKLHQCLSAPIRDILRELRRAWADWTAFCMLCVTHGVSSCGSYRCNRSLFHAEPSEELDESARNKLVSVVATDLAVSANVAGGLLAKQVRRLEKAELLDEGDKYFNGKWYHILIQSRIRLKYPKISLNNDAVLQALMATLNFEEEWAAALTRGLNKILDS